MVPQKGVVAPVAKPVCESSAVLDLAQLNERLSLTSYLELTHSPTQLDVETHAKLTNEIPNDNLYPHLRRWFDHLSSFSILEMSTFPRTSISSDLPDPSCDLKVLQQRVRLWKKLCDSVPYIDVT